MGRNAWPADRNAWPADRSLHSSPPYSGKRGRDILASMVFGQISERDLSCLQGTFETGRIPGPESSLNRLWGSTRTTTMAFKTQPPTLCKSAPKSFRRNHSITGASVHRLRSLHERITMQQVPSVVGYNRLQHHTIHVRMSSMATHSNRLHTDAL